MKKYYAFVSGKYIDNYDNSIQNICFALQIYARNKEDVKYMAHQFCSYRLSREETGLGYYCENESKVYITQNKIKFANMAKGYNVYVLNKETCLDYCEKWNPYFTYKELHSTVFLY